MIKIFRPFLKRQLPPRFVNSHSSWRIPIPSFIDPTEVCLYKLTPSSIRNLSNQSINKTDQTQAESVKPNIRDSLEIDVSQFTEEVPIYLPGTSIPK